MFGARAGDDLAQERGHSFAGGGRSRMGSGKLRGIWRCRIERLEDLPIEVVL